MSKTKEYDEEPVCYCARCYSLNILHNDDIGLDWCGECGCPDILETSIEEWEKLYEGRYKHKFAVKGDIKDSFIFKMSISDLKTELFKSDAFDKILRELYPRFPGGYSKVDSILLLFDKLSKDNRIDDLRLLLIKYKK